MEGKGNKFDYQFNPSKKLKNTVFYKYCRPCHHYGEKNELYCSCCGEKMYENSNLIAKDLSTNLK